MRLDKLLSELKYGTRKELKNIIKKGFVTVNGKIVNKSDVQVNPEKDAIVFDGETVHYIEQFVLMMHKPVGYLSANHDLHDATVFDLLDERFLRYDLNIAGRLDKDAEGLLILTNDGNLIHQIIHPNKAIDKTYHVWTEKSIDNIEDLLKPLTIMDGNDMPFSPKQPTIVSSNDNEAIIKISEGKFHQVKRMFEAIGHRVVRLKRVAINNLTLDETLAEGEVKVLTDQEISLLIKK